MFGKRYIEEEVRKKIESMKQLDRIEFISKVSMIENSVGNFSNALIIFQSLGFIILLFGVNFILRAKLLRSFELNSLGNVYLSFGLLSIVSSLLIVVLVFYAFHKSAQIEKEVKERLEEFLEEKSK